MNGIELWQATRWQRCERCDTENSNSLLNFSLSVEPSNANRAIKREENVPFPLEHSIRVVSTLWSVRDDVEIEERNWN